ncbi:HesA/MoeB/ThiF family protein [Trueperella abortisuis]|uniref:Adenylyltransferase/sulfurtransferase n=1 Tax=Trueperella abortisuis TaxID=445930 RepID=A0ABT9PL44_9ACTO|nr:ThiF family adenylyltransferase [Trueperella abortisuis]MDP9833455.1 adenylyltransferase/sulfurtransferase [Trueperella abortisuis]
MSVRHGAGAGEGPAGEPARRGVTIAALVEPGPELTPDQRERYARHIAREEIGELGQRRLLGARVLMVGAGGLGSPALLYLAAAGVGAVGVVDADRVDITNLQRQVIHSTAAIGELKVDSAARRLKELNPDLAVQTFPVRLTQDNVDGVFAGWDLVLDGTDNLQTRFLISDAAARAGIPVVWGALLGWQAQVSVFWTGPRAVAAGFPGPNGLCLRDLFPVEPPAGSLPTTAEVGLMGAVPGQAGAVMAAEAIKLITGTGRPLVGRVLFLDVLAARTQEIPFAPR